MPSIVRTPLALLALLAVAACEGGDAPPGETSADPGGEMAAEGEPPARVGEGLSAEQEAFWASLRELCGQAFPSFGDEDAERGAMVMHVRHCEEDEIQIPLHIGENRSRTWIVTREATGLRLKHDHRHEDGTEEEITWYGGDTQDAGHPESQDFHADEYTAELIPPAATNVWTMRLVPGERFVYRLVRDGTQERANWAFDLTDPVDPPPAPWGYEDTEPSH